MYYKNGLCYARECSCGIRQLEIMKNRLAFANIPEAFKDLTLDSFNVYAYNDIKSQNKAKTCVKAINYWLSNFDAMNERGMGLYLYSHAKGSGKTRMIVSLANELMNTKHIQVKFCTSIQILNEIKASWDRNTEENENRLLDHLSTAQILIIDDFGAEKSDKPWINERFYQIINSRYTDKKITLFTSNERLDTLDYDDRIVNRLEEMTFAIPFPEESVRDTIAKNNLTELVDGIKNGG